MGVRSPASLAGLTRHSATSPDPRATALSGRGAGAGPAAGSARAVGTGPGRRGLSRGGEAERAQVPVAARAGPATAAADVISLAGMTPPSSQANRWSSTPRAAR